MTKKKGFIRKMPKIDSVRSAFDVILTDMRELIPCVDGIIEKFPKHEKNPCGLGYIMVDELRATDKMVIRGVAYNPQVDREQIMREVSVSMKYLIELINACHNREK